MTSIQEPTIPTAPERPANAVFADQPAWHDHTPAYTDRLGAHRGETVTLRVKTTLPVRRVFLKVLLHGEIEERVAQEIAPLDGQGRWFSFDLPLHAGKVHYAWQLDTGEDNWHLTMAGLHHTRRPYRDWFHYLAGYSAPRWAWSSVFYQIFPDRFRNGNPQNDVRTGEYVYSGRDVVKVEWGVPPCRDLDIHAHYGGDLDGVMEALPYMEDLGVNALWLTPIFTSPSAHRYDTTDYRTIDPHLGGNAAFDALMTATRERHFHVILDGVFNHVGVEHALFQAALHDPSAPERDCFSFHDAPEGELPYVAFMGVPTLPKIDYGCPGAVNEFLDGDSSVVRHWLRHGIAGWRLDVAQQIGRGGSDEGNLELHQRLKRAAREENPEAFILGERFFDSEAALSGDGEDGVMNYHGFGLPIMEWFSGETYKGFNSHITTSELLDVMWDAYHVLAPQIALNQVNLLDSHDVPRALTRLGENKIKLRAALTLLFGYPGVPCLYYGTEIGLSQPERGSMPFNRATMPWDEQEWDVHLRRDVQQLIRVRRESLALQEGNLRLLLQDEDALGYLRSYTHADGRVESAAVIAGRTGERHDVTVNLPGGEWRDARHGEIVSRGGRVTLDVSRGVILLSR